MLDAAPPPNTNGRPASTAPAASCVATGSCPAGVVCPVTGLSHRAVPVLADRVVRPPATSRPGPLPASTTAREMAEGSWYGAGVTCSTSRADDAGCAARVSRPGAGLPLGWPDEPAVLAAQAAAATIATQARAAARAGREGAGGGSLDHRARAGRCGWRGSLQKPHVACVRLAAICPD